MKKTWYIIGFISAGLLYFFLKYVLLKKKSSDKPNGRVLSILDNITIRNKKKLTLLHEKIAKLDKKKVNNEAFKDFSDKQLIDFIKSNLKRRR